MSIELRINQYYSALNDNDLSALKYIMANTENVIHMSVEEIATNCHSSKSSLIRLTQKLAFAGFSEFKYYLRHEQKESHTVYESNLNLLHQDIDETIKLISQTDLTPALKGIHSAKRIFGYGTDWGEKNAINSLARNFMSTGTYMITIPSITEFNWMMDSFTEDDLIILISYSGTNGDLEQNIAVLKLRNIPFISITPLVKNTLSQMATYSFYYHVTPLDFDGDDKKEYNFFITLNIVVDAIFRAYIDYYPFYQQEKSQKLKP